MSNYDYLRKYACSYTWAPSTSPATIEQAREAIDAIRNKKGISIPQLESAISLTAHFKSLMELLNNQALIQDCIFHLHRRQKAGVQVFDDEWGYLCFRILVLAINTSIISKYHYPALRDTLVSMHGKQDADGPLSDGVNVFLAENMDDPYPDQVIGWSSQGSRAAIISKANTLLLLDLLFKDRKGLLRAWSETRSPTLTGLLFILWRCIHTASTPTRWIHFIDIARRNYLVARGDVTSPIQKFHEDVRRRLHIWLSRSTPTAVDLEDARTQLTMLTRRLCSEPTSGLFAVPFTTSVSDLITFVLPKEEEGFTPGVEELFLPLLRESFTSFWRHLKVDYASMKRPRLLVNIATILTILSNFIIDHLRNHPAHEAILKEVLRTIADLGVVETIAKAMILIDSSNAEDGNDITKEKTTGRVRPFMSLSLTLPTISSPEELSTVFRDTFMDWYKTFHYTFSIQDGIAGTPTRREECLKAVIGSWHNLGKSLGHSSRATDYATYTPGCSYARCHDPLATKRAALECMCGQVVYCGLRCQQLDWARYLPMSHRFTCSWSEVD